MANVLSAPTAKVIHPRRERRICQTLRLHLTHYTSGQAFSIVESLYLISSHEIDRTGCQSLHLPVLQWRESHYHPRAKHVQPNICVDRPGLDQACTTGRLHRFMSKQEVGLSSHWCLTAPVATVLSSFEMTPSSPTP